MLDAEAALLMGSLVSLRGTSRLFKGSRKNRPVVVAWVSEPLPPPGMPSWARVLSEALSPIRIGTVWARPLLHFLTYPIHFAIHRLALTAELRREITPSDLRFLHDNLAFLTIGLRERWIDAISVSTKQKQRYLADMGIESAFMPVGQQVEFGRLLELHRDIDLLFIGKTKPKQRRSKLAHVFTEVHRMGLNAYTPKDPIFGEERTKLVNRARIMLHIHNFPWDTPWMRWNLALANGAVVASEPLFLADPLRPNIDFISAPIDRLANEIAELSKDEQRRKAMLENCLDTVNREMTLEVSVGRFCEIVDARKRDQNSP
ncbi:hypothetical protein [Mesorhizobium sp. 10J20-29]